MSRCLAQRSIDHVVLERKEVANSWRTERWDALRLLTPNWQCRLPGYAYEGDDPDGFMTMPEVVDFIVGYAQEIAAPVETGTTVLSLRAADDGYRVVTDQGEWQCPTVVIATGAFNVPRVPDYAEAVPSTVATLTTMQYRNPGQLAEGGVLVVGASATGVQIAHEIRGSGRAVTLAVGEHVRGPRMYRDRDIHWWMEASGVLDERYDEVDDIVRARRVPSMQLGGSLDAVDLRPQRAHPHRGDARRSSRRHQGRSGPVLRVAPKQVRARRPQARSTPRHDRRVGDRQWRRRRRAPAAPVRTHGRPGVAEAGAGSHLGRDPDRSSGRRDFAPTTPGSTYPSSIAKV